METKTEPVAYMIDQSWGWVVVYNSASGQVRTKKIGNHVAATDFRDALIAGEPWGHAWDRLDMSKWVRQQDGGRYGA